MISMNDMDRTTVPSHNTVLGSATRTQKGNDAENSVGADNDSDPMNEGQPFHTTHLGKIPPEIREKIIINLLALPPPFAGRNIAKQDTGTSHELAANAHDNPSNTPCYYLKNSWLKTLQTCRQVYLEAFPVFYGRKSYYVASADKLISLFEFGHPGAPGPLAFCGDGITSLCVKGVVRYTTGTGWGALEGSITMIGLDDKVISATSKLQGWENLRKISLCMRVGEEDSYLTFLSHLPGLEHGVIDFLDDSHWSIHPQYRGSEWNNQYTIYTNTHNLMGVSSDKIYACCRKTYLDLRDFGLKEGDERYVEVDVKRGDNAEYMTEDELSAAIECSE